MTLFEIQLACQLYAMSLACLEARESAARTLESATSMLERVREVAR